MNVCEPVVIEPEGQLEAAVIWLHGMMDNPDHWSRRMVTHARKYPSWKWVLLRAPQLPMTYLNGRMAAAWGDFKDTAAVNVGGVDHEREDCIHPEMVRAVHRAIESVHSRDGLPYSRIAVAGFSQGAALAAESVFKFPHTLAGQALLCGWLTPGARSVITDNPNRLIPLLIGHSRADTDVKFECAEFSYQRLLDVHAPVKFHVLSNPDHIPAAFQMLSEAVAFLAASFTDPSRLREAERAT